MCPLLFPELQLKFTDKFQFQITMDICRLNFLLRPGNNACLSISYNVNAYILYTYISSSVCIANKTGIFSVSSNCDIRFCNAE
jgi:hypothetical protein